MLKIFILYIFKIERGFRIKVFFIKYDQALYFFILLNLFFLVFCVVEAKIVIMLCVKIFNRLATRVIR